MAKDKKQFFIKKLNFDKLELNVSSKDETRNSFLKILNINSSKSNYEEWKLMDANIEENFSILLFHKRTFKEKEEIAMYNFLSTVVENEELENLNEERHDFIIIFIKKMSKGNNFEAIYAVTTGYGYIALDPYIDREFPIKIAAKIMKPSELRRVTERDITGEIFASNKTFRKATELPVDDYIGRILKEATGHIKENIKNDPRFKPLLQSEKEKDEKYEKRPINCDFTISAIKIACSLSFYQLENLVHLFYSFDKQSLTSEEKNFFEHLHGIELLSKEEGERIFNNLKNSIYARIKKWLTEVGDEFENIEIVDEAMDEYLKAEKYILLKNGSKNDAYNSKIFFNQPPRFLDILNQIKHENPELTDWKDLLEQYRLFTFSEEKKIKPFELWKLINTEVPIEGKKYFLLDNKWYKISNSYIENITRRLKNILEKDNCFRSGNDNQVMTINWKLTNKVKNGKTIKGLENEGDYNERYAGLENYIVGDRFLDDNIELFDVLKWDDENIYICHNKIGFSASIRDVCSQIGNAAKLIRNGEDSGEYQTLKSYYRKYMDYNGKKEYLIKSKERLRKYSENEFIELFKKNKIFIIGVADEQKACAKKMSLDQLLAFESSIMKIEFLRLFATIKGIGQLYIEHILPDNAI